MIFGTREFALPSRYCRDVTDERLDPGRGGFAFPGAAVLSFLLLVGLLVNPDFIQGYFIQSDSKPIPLLKPNEVFTLTSDTQVKPKLSGDFSGFEEDGIWLLQGAGVLEFRLPKNKKSELIEFGLRALETETMLRIVSSPDSTITTTIVEADTVILSSKLASESEHSVRISCERSGISVDLGPDTRDLCIKLLWVRVT